ncbi:MAG TPA: pantoate--beta-alanine ligase [Acidimicrobiales bacterium]|nr:pantoate--beta-alanine ligase [Acidimicrobiales bacterium]
MQVIDTIAGFRKALDAERAEGKTVGLVPTMGALHAGHASLIDAARATCDVVALTLFVNPLQFGPNEDLAKYPRPFEADVVLATAHGADFVLHPSVEEMYGPNGTRTTIHVAEVSEGMEGAVRPGHFDGVATVVAKLFNAAGPCRAFFGEKDYQQLQVVTQLVRDLSFPVEIVPCPIVREADGLALSSRNVYLSPEDRAAATVLHRALQAGAADLDHAVEVITDIVNHEPRATLDYAEAVVTDHETRLLVAAKFGTTRLLDNIGVTH